MIVPQSPIVRGSRLSSTENRVERTETSIDLGRQAASRAEFRMLINGELVAAATGEDFDNAIYGADAPFGGYKNSGVGRQCGIEGFEQYLETKTIGCRIPRQR